MAKAGKRNAGRLSVSREKTDTKDKDTQVFSRPRNVTDGIARIINGIAADVCGLSLEELDAFQLLFFIGNASAALA